MYANIFAYKKADQSQPRWDPGLASSLARRLMTEVFCTFLTWYRAPCLFMTRLSTRIGTFNLGSIQQTVAPAKSAIPDGVRFTYVIHAVWCLLLLRWFPHPPYYYCAKHQCAPDFACCWGLLSRRLIPKSKHLWTSVSILYPCTPNSWLRHLQSVIYKGFDLSFPIVHRLHKTVKQFTARLLQSNQTRAQVHCQHFYPLIKIKFRSLALWIALPLLISLQSDWLALALVGIPKTGGVCCKPQWTTTHTVQSKENFCLLCSFKSPYYWSVDAAELVICVILKTPRKLNTALIMIAARTGIRQAATGGDRIRCIVPAIYKNNSQCK